MTLGSRSVFEVELLKELKEVSASFPGVIASKNKLKFKFEKK